MGIRDISLSFDSGEFVAVTGKSGSGKSTLLRVLGGLETFESGEMYVDGQSVSHFNDDDRAKFLQENISFIFQDYNILESFTVLENVEFALTGILDVKERRRRAREIIDRVGLSGKIKSRGSKLSGGEKQRTVIARAIAKDSPIILADEPTGNLDSKCAKEILQLLHEVSKGKLLIVVTHNYEDTAQYATRHIRLFDGNVESDEHFVEEKSGRSESGFHKDDKYDFSREHKYIFREKDKKLCAAKERKADLRDALLLSRRRFTSRPIQNGFACLFFSAATVILFLILSLFLDMYSTGNDLKQDNRLLVINNSGEYIGYDEAAKIAKASGAENFLVNDYATDENFRIFSTKEDSDRFYYYPSFRLSYGENIKPDTGKLPEKPGEALLYVPTWEKNIYSVGEEFTVNRLFTVKITGISYYCGGNDRKIMLPPESTREWAGSFAQRGTSSQIMYSGKAKKLSTEVIIDYSLKGNEAILYAFDGFSDITGTQEVFLGSSSSGKGKKTKIEVKKLSRAEVGGYVTAVSEDFYRENFGLPDYKNESSLQISLYFDKGADIQKIKADIEDEGYKTFSMKNYEKPTLRYGFAFIILWGIIIAGICGPLVFSLGRIIRATKQDIPVFRTMGIRDRVIKLSTYFQLGICAAIALAVQYAMYFIVYYTSLGQSVEYIGGLGMLILSCIIIVIGFDTARRYNKMLYGEKLNEGLGRVNK